MAQAEDSALPDDRETDYVKIVSRIVKIIITEVGKLSESVTQVNSQLKEIDSSVQKLPSDNEFAKKAREKEQALKKAVGGLEEPNKALDKNCQLLSKGWRDYMEIVRRAGEPSTIQETRKMVEQLKLLLKYSKQCQVDSLSFQEKLNVTQRENKEAEDVCAEAAANEKDKQTTAKVVGGVATTALAIGAGAAAGVVTGGLAAPAVGAATAKVAAGVLGVGAATAGGVTVTLSIVYGNWADKFRESKNRFNQCSTQLSNLMSNIIALHGKFNEMIDQLEVGKKLHRERLADKMALAMSDAKLAEYMERFGPL